MFLSGRTKTTSNVPHKEHASKEPTVDTYTGPRLDPFAILPTELSILTLSFLPLGSIAAAARVHSKWRDIVNNEALWMQVCHDQGFQPLPDDEGMTWKELCKNCKDSRILNLDQKKILKQWLNTGSGKGKAWELQYRMTRDGSRPRDFGDICHHLESSVTVCESIASGAIFGGYCPTAMNFDASTNPLPPEVQREAFIFSLKNCHGSPPCRMFAKEDRLHFAIVPARTVGQLFGNGFDLGILGYPSSNEPYAWCRIGDTYEVPPELGYAGDQQLFLETERNIRIKEVEVYAPRKRTE